MARFIFKLEGVLRQRKHVEQEKMRALAECLKQQAECESQLASLQLNVQKSNDDLRHNHLRGVLDMGFLAAHRRFILAMQRQGGAIAQQLAAAQQRVTEARSALAESAKQRKIMEKLREKRETEWKTALAGKELRELDEIGAQLGFDALAGEGA